MALEGDLSLFGLSDVLQIVAQQRKTGILTVQGQDDILAISFLGGEIVAADALNQSFEGLLGTVLARRGAVGRERFSAALEQQRSSGERLIDFLVTQGVTGREQILEALRELTYRLLVDVLRWREGQFKFYGGEEVAYEEGVTPLRVDEVLMRALGDAREEPSRAAAVPHGYLAYARVSTAKKIREIPDGVDEAMPLDDSVVWLTPDEGRLLERLDGQTPVEQLARQLGMDESRMYYALHRLLQADVARLASEDGVPPPPRSRPAAPQARRERQRAADEKVEAPAAVAAHPATSARRATAALASFAAALALLVVAWRAPSGLLFASPELGPHREAFDRLRRLSRLELIDRAARTYHLLEGRYPGEIGELVRHGLLPSRARFDPSGEEYRMQASSEQYSLTAAASVDPAIGAREGVFGDFLLDRELFAGLEQEGGVPLVLLD